MTPEPSTAFISLSLFGRLEGATRKTKGGKDMSEQERAEARKALDNATAGPWADNVFEPYADIYSYNHLTEEPDGLIARCTHVEDAHLLSNAPTWLRNSLDREEQLIAENEHLKNAVRYWQEDAKNNSNHASRAAAKVVEQDKEIQRLQEHIKKIERAGYV